MSKRKPRKKNKLPDWIKSKDATPKEDFNRMIYGGRCFGGMSINIAGQAKIISDEIKQFTEDKKKKQEEVARPPFIPIYRKK